MSITPCRPKWKGTMTDRERFNNQMHYKPVDRCFNMEFGYWEENFTQWDHLRRERHHEQLRKPMSSSTSTASAASAGHVWMHPRFAEHGRGRDRDHQAHP